MKNFDINNLVNPFLVEGAYILYNNELYQVYDMTKDYIIIKNAAKDDIQINDDEWQPIRLDNDWLKRLGISLDEKIKNPESGADWVVKFTGKHFYLIIYNEFSYGENPVISLNDVHKLQEWYYRLTGTTLQ